MSDLLVLLAMVVLGFVVNAVVMIVVSRRRGGSSVSTVLAVVLLALSLAAVFATHAHVETIDELQVIEFDEDRQPILDDSSLPGIGMVVGILSAAAGIVSISWVGSRSSPVGGRRPGPLAVSLTGLAVVLGLATSVFSLTLPQSVYDRRLGGTWADWVDVLSPAVFVVGCLASASVARAGRNDRSPRPARPPEEPFLPAPNG